MQNSISPFYESDQPRPFFLHHKENPAKIFLPLLLEAMDQRQIAWISFYLVTIFFLFDFLLIVALHESHLFAFCSNWTPFEKKRKMSANNMVERVKLSEVYNNNIVKWNGN